MRVVAEKKQTRETHTHTHTFGNRSLNNDGRSVRTTGENLHKRFARGVARALGAPRSLTGRTMGRALT